MTRVYVAKIQGINDENHTIEFRGCCLEDSMEKARARMEDGRYTGFRLKVLSIIEGPQREYLPTDVVNELFNKLP